VERQVGGVPTRVYTPHGEEPFPVLVWCHGGGWVLGSAQMYDAVCRDLAVSAGCVVVSVDYRLAPEHVAPAAFDDALTVTTWVLENAGEIDGDPARVAVGGDSAGGNLSALLAQRLGRQLVFQLLVYPVTDLTSSHRSLDENAEGYILTKETMEWFVESYLADTAIAPDDPSVSPLFAADDVIAAVAPALVITAEFDPLRDEGEAYGERMRSFGVDVTIQRFDGQVHTFYMMQAAVPASLAAIRQSADLLRAAFRDQT
jgi:acetyl esterase